MTLVLLTNLALVLLANPNPDKRREAEAVLEEAVAVSPIGFTGASDLLAQLHGQNEEPEIS